MMKKSEQFRREIQRPKKKKKVPLKKKRTTGVDTALPGVSATQKKRGKKHTAERNESRHAKRKASVALEDSGTGRPSRKSSRASANRIKSDSNLRRRQSGRTTSASSRASRGK